MKLVDTNILMEKPSVIERNDIIISIKVLKELDGLKRHQNNEVAEKARRAAIYISRRLENLIFDNTEEAIPTDDLLLKIASQKGYGIITNDVYLKIRAVAQHIETESYSEKDAYCGVLNLYFDLDENGYNEELDKILTDRKLPENISLRENQYLILRDNQNKDNYLSIYCYQDNQLIPINHESSIKNQWYGEVVPRNAEQICLFHSLNNPNITILYAGGGFGRGKTILLNNYALQELQREHIKKIIYVPNNAYVKNSMELGYMPGDSFQKIIPSIGPLIDLIGIDEVSRLI